MPPWVAKEKMGTLLLASEMPVAIPWRRTVSMNRKQKAMPERNVSRPRSVPNDDDGAYDLLCWRETKARKGDGE